MSTIAFCERCSAALTDDDDGMDRVCRKCAEDERPTVRPGSVGDDALDASGALEAAARITMSDDAIVAFLQATLVAGGPLALAPNIPAAKEAAARRVHHAHMAPDERILALYDDTVFGSAEVGFVLTSHRLAWKNLVGPAEEIPWAALDPDAMYQWRHRLVLRGDKAIEVSGDPDILQSCADAFYVIALSARRDANDPRNPNASGVVPSMRISTPPAQIPVSPPAPNFATPPPPHAVSFHSYAVHAVSQRPPAFACWHCQTPLYWNTPQCAHCGATPRAQGWLRTG